MSRPALPVSGTATIASKLRAVLLMQRRDLTKAHAEPMILGVFEGAGESYALARDSAKLPSQNRPWHYRGEIDIELADRSNFGIDVARIVDDVRRTGFHHLSRHEVLYLLAVVGVRRPLP
jgi:hypothetical protein